MSHYTWKIEGGPFRNAPRCGCRAQEPDKITTGRLSEGVPGTGHWGGETIATQCAAKTLGTATLGTTAQKNQSFKLKKEYTVLGPSLSLPS